MLEYIGIREILAIIIISYFIGSIPTAYIVGKLVKRIDIRDYGSGNVGATNVLRVLGKGFGILTLVIDVFKGSFAVFITSTLLSEGYNYIGWIYIISGIFAFLGHIFSVWLKFKGGKGVAVAAGVFLYIAPIELLISFVLFVLIVYITRYVSAGSVISIPFFTFLIYLNLFNNPWSEYKAYFIASLFMSIGVIISHRQNIKRIIAGEESKISFKQKDS